MYNYFIMLEDKITKDIIVIRIVFAKRVRGVYKQTPYINFKKYNLIISKVIDHL